MSQSQQQSLFCPHPWISLCAETKGVLAPCSISQDYTKEALAFPSPEAYKSQIQNSPMLKQLRLDLLNGVKNPNCSICWRAEESGATSMRQHAWRFSPHDAEWARKVTRADGGYDGPIEYYDLRPGNKCNLKCRMCGIYESSAWQSDHEFLTGQPFNPGAYNLAWGEDPRQWRHILSHVHESLAKVGVIHISFVGGEPLMEKNHLQFLRRCVEEGLAGKIELRYTTNATILPDDLLEIWKSFRKILVGASFDGIGAVNDYIRFPSQWKTVEKNILKLAELDYVYVWVQSAATIYNIYYMPEIYQWAHGREQNYLGRREPLDVHSHLVHHPPHLSINQLPLSAIKPLERKIADAQRWKGAGFLTAALEFAKERPIGGISLQEFWSFTHKLDERRRQNFSQAMPEWNEILQAP